MSDRARECVLGIFVGGRGSRMGGRQKALLTTPDGLETLLERTLRIARQAGLPAVLVGRAELGAPFEGLVQLPDADACAGPLAGLSALLEYAGDRHALAVACDMPYVSAGLLRRLAEAQPEAVVLAPRDAATGKWQPLFARYAPRSVSGVLAREIAAGARSFQAVFRALAVEELELSSAEASSLRDWDTPDDMR
jgi:molybdenum cofactor guanylyltransferase